MLTLPVSLELSHLSLVWRDEIRIVAVVPVSTRAHDFYTTHKAF